LVPVTGGLGSVAPFLYLLPLALCSIQHKPGRALAAGILGSFLYLAVTWYPHSVPGYWLQIGPRIAALALATPLAVINAAMEAARVEEVVAMREQLALADYRQRLSQEMHDGIQHDLVGLTVRLELARQLMAEDPRQAARVAVDQRFVARQAADELRTLVYLLRSPVVEREGFVGALRHRLSLFAQRSAISAPLRIEGDNVPLSPQAAHAAFRIVQEALTNAEKHSRASRVDVILNFGSDAFECAVRDDGIGFDVASAADRVSVGSGFGLGGMKQRADSAGGWLKVNSQPGAGTEIAFGFPLEASPAGRSARDTAAPQ
jgi:signal transduction histidine kinase